jgi:hypothetical protein
VRDRLRRSQRGKLLADFALFDAVQCVYLVNKERRRSHLDAAAELRKEQEFDAQRLRIALLQAIRDGDDKTFDLVAATLRKLKADPRWWMPLEPDLEKILLFFRRHAHEKWDYTELDAAIKKETGLQFEAKTLRRWCKLHGFQLESARSWKK